MNFKTKIPSVKQMPDKLHPRCCHLPFSSLTLNAEASLQPEEERQGSYPVGKAGCQQSKPCKPQEG